MSIIGHFQIIKFYCMQKPISKRNHPYPREFLIGAHKLNKTGNLYTFNPESSTYSSTHKQSIMEKDANPQEPNIVKQNTIKEANNKVYYDADAKFDSQLVQLNEVSKIDVNLLKQDDQILRKQQPINEISQHLCNDKAMMVQNKSEIFKESRLIKSGLIVRQLKVDQQSQQTQTKVQKQFNRLGLSLMGIKRSKYNKSCLQKKTSFSVSHVSTKGSKERKQSRYSPSKEQEEQVYKYSYYPFKAKQIESLKNQINRISGSRAKKMEKNDQLQQYLEQNINNDNFQTNINVPTFSEFKERNSKQTVVINIKTSISALKDLLFYNLKKKQVKIQLPKFFTHPPSQLLKINSFDPQVLNNQCLHIFTSLNIPVTSLNIRKYSNCLVIINKNICIVWHEGREGKKYIGEWKNKYFDEGQKEGLGLEWAPGRYVYYGQFKQNKRHGFGLMRKSDSAIKLGYWKLGKYFQYGIQKNG